MGKIIRHNNKTMLNTVLIRDNPVTKISIIKLSNLTTNNIGIYSCVASVGLKIDTINFELTKYETEIAKINIVQILLEEKLVKEFKDFELICPTKNIQQKSTFEWLFNGKLDFHSNDIFIFKNKLIAKNVNDNLNGYFMCRSYYNGDNEVIEYYMPVRVLKIEQPMLFAKSQVKIKF